MHAHCNSHCTCQLCRPYHQHFAIVTDHGRFTLINVQVSAPAGDQVSIYVTCFVDYHHRLNMGPHSQCIAHCDAQQLTIIVVRTRPFMKLQCCRDEAVKVLDKLSSKAIELTVKLNYSTNGGIVISIMWH